MPAPVFGLAGGDVEAADGRLLAVVGPGEAPPHPLLEGGDRGGRQFALRRHLQIAVVADRMDEQALVGLAGHGDGLGRVKIGPRVEGQAPLGVARLGGVAFRAVRHQQRPHLGLEKLEVRRGVGLRFGPGHRRQGEEQDAMGREPKRASRHREILRKRISGELLFNHSPAAGPRQPRA